MRSQLYLSLAAALILGSGLGAAPAAGQAAAAQNPLTLKGDAPIDISAERCEVFQAEDKTICTGKVRVSQDKALLTADKMTLLGATGGDGFDSIEGEGNVRYASGEDAISGDYALYEAATTTLNVKGDVVVIQGQQIMVGGSLVYNTESGALRFGPGEDGRVRGLFHTASTTTN